MRELVTIAVALMLSACASGDGRYPSLQPRAAEAIDPRVPIIRPANDRPVSATMAARLAQLVDAAMDDQASFEHSAAQAERLAAAAGAPPSESWMIAQEALSAAIAAARPATTALADIDALASSALQSNGGIAPNDLKAIESAAQKVQTIARGQTQRIDAIKRRLAS